MELNNIHLSRGPKALVRNGNLTVRPGEITLLLGASGCGKSTLLYALADLDPSVSFSCDRGPAPLKDVRIGLVPQNSAPFEELRTARRNVAFAHAHAPKGGPEFDEVWRELAQALGLGDDWEFPLSGGQSQRTAIARALASGAEVLLCDEPTSGLDPGGKERAIQLFRAVADRGIAVLVVTHDTEWKREGVADSVYRLIGGGIRSEPVGAAPPAEADADVSESSAPVSSEVPGWLFPFRSLGRLSWWLALLPAALWATVFGADRVRCGWFARFAGGFLKRLLGPSSWIYLAAAGFLLGFAVFFFSVSSLRAAPHLETLIVPELVAGSGFGLYRVILPLVAALLVAAKSGSALAAEFGNRQYGKQIDVFRTIGASPEGYLLLPALLVLGFGVPLLFLVSFAAAALGSMTAFLVSYPMQTAYAWREDFFRLLVQPDSYWFVGTGWNLVKTGLAGAGIAIISYRFGTLPKKDSGEIGSHISAATLWGSLWSLAVFAVVAVFEFIA